MKILTKKEYKEVIESLNTLNHLLEVNRIRKDRYKLAYEESIKNYDELLMAALSALKITRDEMILNTRYQFN